MRGIKIQSINVSLQKKNMVKIMGNNGMIELINLYRYNFSEIIQNENFTNYTIILHIHIIQ
jgi:hypothetical protein